MLLRCNEEYAGVLPFKCGNLDCQVPLEPPFAGIHVGAPIDGEEWVCHMLVCGECKAAIIAAAKVKRLEFVIE